MRLATTLALLLGIFCGCGDVDTVSENRDLKDDRYQYQCWEGGPHIVLPNSVASAWAGDKIGANPLDPDSDYGRACAIEDRFGFIEVDGKQALVFDSPPLVAWDPESTNSQHYFFVLWAWASVDTDDLLDRAKTDTEMSPTETIWEVPEGGARMIFAGDDPSGTIVGRINIPNLAGRYQLHTGEYDVKDDGKVIVLRFDLIQPESNHENGE